MRPDVESPYQQAITDLGVRKRWYQLGTDLYFAAVVAAVDGGDSEEILARNELLAETLPSGNQLHLIKQTVAAITAARGLDVKSFIADADAVADMLRDATRSKTSRRVAASVIVATGEGGYEVRSNRVSTLYQEWNQQHRVLTGSLDLVLAAVTEAVGIGPVTALDRAGSAFEQLNGAGYKSEWEVARILALDEPSSSVERFVKLADDLRGRRRKLLTDRRHTVAIAALADHPSHELGGLMSHRARAVRVGRFRPGRSTALTLAALLTLGASATPEHRLHPAFHGFVLREHFVTSNREATSE